MGWSIIGIALAALAISLSFTVPRRGLPRVTFDEFITLYNAYTKQKANINLYPYGADVDINGYHLTFTSIPEKIKYLKWRRKHKKQVEEETNNNVLKELRKGVNLSADVPADVYEAILNELKKKYGV